MSVAFSAVASASGALVEGNATSPIRVIIYEDLQCGDCANFRKILDDHLLPKYAATVAFEHRDFPLPKHSWARKAAVAGRFFASVKPEIGVRFRRETMAAMKEITPESFEKHVAGFAAANGVDAARAIAALSDKALIAEVEKDLNEGIARGIARTPTVFVDGEPFIERFPLAEIQASIEKATKGAR